VDLLLIGRFSESLYSDRLIVRHIGRGFFASMGNPFSILEISLQDPFKLYSKQQMGSQTKSPRCDLREKCGLDSTDEALITDDEVKAEDARDHVSEVNEADTYSSPVVDAEGGGGGGGIAAAVC
jgi:hypothetical protein